MKKKDFIMKLYKFICEENLSLYKEMFETTKLQEVKDEYGKSALEFYQKISEKDKSVFFKIIKQTSIDTISSILALLDGVTSLEEQDDEFILTFEKSKEKINGDLQDIFLEFDEKHR